jgi:hypothetical protein
VVWSLLLQADSGGPSPISDKAFTAHNRRAPSSRRLSLISAQFDPAEKTSGKSEGSESQSSAAFEVSTNLTDSISQPTTAGPERGTIESAAKLKTRLFTGIDRQVRQLSFPDDCVEFATSRQWNFIVI